MSSEKFNGGGGVACLIIVSLQVLSFENLTLNQSIWRLEKFNGGVVVVACLIIVSLQVLSFENLTLNFEFLSSDLNLDHGLDTGPWPGPLDRTWSLTITRPKVYRCDYSNWVVNGGLTSGKALLTLFTTDQVNPWIEHKTRPEEAFLMW